MESDSRGRSAMDFTKVKAMTFDVFGTVVDWRGSIVRELRQLGEAKGISADWEAFADRWRGGYGPSMQRVRGGELPWTKIDALHRMILDDLLEELEDNRSLGGRDRPPQSRLAQAGRVAGLPRRSRPPEEPVRDSDALQRERGPPDQHGQARGAPLGLYPLR